MAPVTRSLQAYRLVESREVPLGGLRAMTVRRTLPDRWRPTVGAWCFVDQFGPERHAMEVLPHPHTGLQTVTWPWQGRVRHRDSLGSDVVVRPGELDLMTAGRGVSHSEFSLAPDGSAGADQLHGLQLWVALPESARFDAPAFAQVKDVPEVVQGGIRGTVFVGSMTGSDGVVATSPARTYSPLLGADLVLPAGESTLTLDPSYEHGLLAVDEPVSVDGVSVGVGQLLCVDAGPESVTIGARGPARVVLLGGTPFEEELVMWWNFVGRTHDEIVADREEWEAGSERFGQVSGHDGRRIPAPPMPALRLKPRSRRD